MIIVPLWDDQNITHIARHSVTPDEVEQVLAHPDALVQQDDRHRAGRLLVWGRTRADRYLLVALDQPTPAGDAYVLTARPMTPRERRSYEEAP